MCRAAYFKNIIFLGLIISFLALSFFCVPVAAADYAQQRETLIEELITERPHIEPIDDTYVIEAIRNTARHEFVRRADRRRAYQNRPLPIGYGQTISQPFIVAYMNQLASIRPGDRVLEIGTGSGYHAAVISEVADTVYTIEIVEPLYEQAKQRFEDFGFDNIMTRYGDGYYGWEEAGPFDAIVVTAAASHIPPPLMEQLSPGGMMVIPVGQPYQTQSLVLVEKNMEGQITQRTVLAVRFVPFIREKQD